MQKDKEIDQKDKVILLFAKLLKGSGKNIEEIQKQTGLSKEKIESL